MLVIEGAPRADRLVPAIDGFLLVVGMDRVRPSETLVRLTGLTGDRAPARLVTEHPARSVVGPEHAADGLDGGAEARLARQQLALNALLVDGRGQHRQKQDEEGCARHVEGQVLLPLRDQSGMGAWAPAPTP